MTDGLSAGDILALSKDDDCNRNDMWNNPFVYLVWIWAFSALGGNGFGFGNRGGFGGYPMGQINNDFLYTNLRGDLNSQFNQLDRAVTGIANGLCDGFYAQNSTMLQGFNTLGREFMQGVNGINANITQSRFDNQQCCCETNRNIDALRYEGAKNTCDIIESVTANTQRIIDQMTQNTIQELRDGLQAANFQLSQQAQNATLINTLRPTPIPAYVTCSPYEAAGIYGHQGYGNYYGGCWPLLNWIEKRGEYGDIHPSF